MSVFFSWERFFSNIPKIVPYFGVTCSIAFYGILFGSVAGFLIAWIKIKSVPFLRTIAAVFVSFMRGTPMIVQLMLVYYGLPPVIDAIFGTNINTGWDKVIFAYITFACNEAAFLSAIFYGAITAVPVGQLEAGYSVGLTTTQTLRKIILPQAVRYALPAFGTDVIGVFQGSSLVFMIGVTDIMGRAKTIGYASGHVLEAYLFAAVLYIAISLLLRLLFAVWNRRLDYGGSV